MYGHIVIAGGGQAAVQAVDTLRRKGFTGKLSMVGDEPWLPYQRPPLSKKYLAGALERERLLIRPAQFFPEHGIDAHLGRRVTAVAPRERHVRLDDGLVLPYDALVLATGSRPRRLPVPGADLAGVHYLRTLADADRIRAECTAGGRLLVIGGGYIGLEVAATARELGMEVTVLEMAERVMSRVTCPELSRFYEAEHARRGVRIRCHETVRALHGDPRTGRVRAVLTEQGTEYPADAVIMRGAPASRSFSACYLRGGELIAIDTVNQPKDQMAARKLIAAHVRPNLDKLADPAIGLKDTV